MSHSQMIRSPVAARASWPRKAVRAAAPACVFSAAPQRSTARRSPRLPPSCVAATNGSAEAQRRTAVVERVTKETKVSVSIDLDGTGVCTSKSGIPFLDHMMDQISSHGLIDLVVEAEGDYWIDDHHTNEDTGLAFGTALAQALGDRKGIHRFGEFTAPLDEALIHVVLVRCSQARWGAAARVVRNHEAPTA